MCQSGVVEPLLPCASVSCPAMQARWWPAAPQWQTCHMAEGELDSGRGTHKLTATGIN